MRKATLGDVAEFINGAAFQPSDWEDDGARIIRIQNLTDKSKPFNRTTRRVKDSLYVQPGDFLVSWSATLGVFEWDQPDEAVLNQHIFRVVPDLESINRRYLWHALHHAVTGMERHTHGATMKHINRREFLGTSIPLPPIEEQRRIAAVLDAAEALRAKRRQALAKLETLTQSIFIDMFGDPHANPMGWPTAELADVVADGTTVTYGIVQAGAEFEDGVPYVRSGDIVDGEVKLDELRHTDPAIAARFPRSQVQTGEIVMSIRATVGTTALVPPELDGANLTQGTARIAPGPRSETDFILQHLRSQATQRWIQRQVKGATFREITLGRLRELPIRLPPVDLQRKFAARCRVSDKTRSTFHRSTAQLDTVFASLQQRAFRGEL